MIYSISVTKTPFSVAMVCVGTLDTFHCYYEDDFEILFDYWVRPGNHIIVGTPNSLDWIRYKDTRCKYLCRPLPPKEDMLTREQAKLLSINYDLYTAICIAWRYHEI